MILKLDLKKEEILKILSLFLVWRVVLFIISYFSPKLFPIFGARFPYWEDRLVGSQLPHFIWSFGNFDGVHYLGIAKDAYAYQFTQAFFPLYPILVKIFSTITQNMLLSALIVSNVAFLIGMFVFYKFVKINYSQNTADWSLVFLLVFPTSFYFGAAYTESLFLLMIISSFYLAQKDKLLLASFVGMLASTTRLVGVFLGPALAVGQNLKKIPIPLVIVSLGLISYAAFLQIKFNNAFYFLTSQTIFGQERSTDKIILLPQVLWRYIKILATTKDWAFFNASLELAATILIFSLLFIAFKKKFKKEWLLFCFLAVITPTLTGTFTSMPRYILIVFPMYILFAQIKNILFKVSLVFMFLILQIICLSLFAQGYWVA